MDETRVESSPPAFWSPTATVGWALLVVAVFITVQVVVVIGWVIVVSATDEARDSGSALAEVATNGDVLSLSTLASAVICGALVLVLASVGRHSPTRESLALEKPNVASLAKWSALTLVLIAVSDGLTTLLGKPIVPDFMTDIVANTTVLPLLWVALVLAAPLFEELFFRGFLIAGLRRGAVGDAGAIILSSLAWASIHIQYGLYEIGTIFVFGAVLGLARVGSRSLWVPVAMHMTANLVATLEATLL